MHRLIIIIAVNLLMFANVASQEQDSQYGGTLQIAINEPTQSLHPHYYLSGGDGPTAQEKIYEPLVRVDFSEPDFPILPHLATEWTINDDATIWTFTLREGVTFHHGKPFTAEDVVANFEYAINPENGTSSAQFYPFLESIIALDDNTVQFNLNTPFASFLYVLADVYGGIMPSDMTREELEAVPTGTGPFRFEASIPDERVILVRNEDYWNSELPYLDRIEMVILTDEMTQVAALTSGQVNVIADVTPAQRAILGELPDVILNETPLARFPAFVMDTTTEPFDNPLVRRALRVALDREAIREVILGDSGVVAADSVFVPGTIFDTELTIEQDYELARELLMEAGYADGVSVTLTIGETVATAREAAVIIQNMAEPAGFDIEIERVPISVYWTEYYGQTPLHESFIIARIDPSTNLNIFFETGALFNSGGYSNPEVDQLIREAQAIVDPSARIDLYRELHELFIEEGPYIIPYFRPQTTAATRAVNGVNAGSFLPGLGEAWLEQE